MILFTLLITFSIFSESSSRTPRAILKVVTILSEPFSMRNECSTNEENCDENSYYKGFFVDFLDHMRNYGFGYQLEAVQDNDYGNMNLNGTWTGLIGELVNGRADLALAPIIRTPVRERMIDLTVPFMRSGISVMMGKASSSMGILLIFKPFTLLTWIIILIGIIIYIIFAVLVHSKLYSTAVEKSDSKLIVPNSDSCGKRNFFCGPGEWELEKKSVIICIAVMVWYLSLVLFICCYISNLAAILTKEKMRKDIVTFAELADQTDIRYGMLKGGSTQRFFETSPDPTFQKMWTIMNRKSDSVLVSSYAEGIEKVRESNGKYAFILEEVFNDYTNDKEPCDTWKLVAHPVKFDYHLGLAKGSRYKENINSIIKDMKTNGIIEELRRKWLAPNECEPTTHSEDQPTGLQFLEMLIPILILILAIILMAVAFFLLTRKTDSYRPQIR